MLSVKRHLLTFFSVTRLQNGLLVVLAQYLSAIFILGLSHPVSDLLENLELHLLVASSFFVVTGGYLINQYYDHPKDLINRPLKTVIDGQWSLSSLMRGYLLLNLIAFLMALKVSLLAALFFVGYITTIWLYSHRIRSLFIWGSLLSAFLAVCPIVVLFLYYRHFEIRILLFAGFLFLLLWILVQLKDLNNLKGDLSIGLHSLPIKLGESKTRNITAAMLFILATLALGLSLRADLGQMHLYFISSIVVIVLVAIELIFSFMSLSYLKMRLLLKFWVLLGTLSILLFDMNRLHQLKAFIFAL
jgi:4-hydroxybenzoate polyprenyltransferase